MAANVTPLERELITLIKKSFEIPARLKPSDLDLLRKVVGDDALDYLLVIACFHFVNRIADLLDVPLEGLPKPLRRFGFLRRLTRRVAGVLLAKMDLANREYRLTYDNALTNLQSGLTITSEMELESALAAFKPRPKLVEVFHLLIVERDSRSSLDRKILAKIHAAVEKALPASVIDAQGLHPVPDDPIEAFAFVGTRYAYRTTKRMINGLRQIGYDDPGILDLAIAVADANLWARIYRLADLKPELFYLNPGH
jgi:alkylhydroperoxidase family enzyme